MTDLSRITTTLDAAHAALRAVDASDTTIPQTEKTLDLVTAAVEAVEKMARDLGYRLPEMRGIKPLGDGMLCSGGLWVVKVGVVCPICGAPPVGGCHRDLDFLASGGSWRMTPVTLRSWRLAHGFTRADGALLLGIPVRTLDSLEAGRSPTSALWGPLARIVDMLSRMPASSAA